MIFASIQTNVKVVQTNARISRPGSNRSPGNCSWAKNEAQGTQRRMKTNGWSMTRWKGASTGGDLDVEIVVASGNSAVPVAVLESGGGETGGDDAGVTVVGDVVGAQEVVA